jgi:hypothetical protein
MEGLDGGREGQNNGERHGRNGLEEYDFNID